MISEVKAIAKTKQVKVKYRWSTLNWVDTWLMQVSLD